MKPDHVEEQPLLGKVLDVESQASPPAKNVQVLGVSLNGFKPSMQFLILSCGTCVFFLACSFIEELMFAGYADFSFAWTMTAIELMQFSGFACIERAKTTNESALQLTLPSYKYFWYVALAMTFSRGLTNYSLQYLNYPTQVIFKSAKLLTIQIGSVFMLGKQYTRRDWFVNALLVMSAILFSLGDSQASPNFNMFGVVVVVLSLVGDSFHSNGQEFIMKKKGSSLMEMMVFSNFFAGVCVSCVAILKGEVGTALDFFGQHPEVFVFITVRTLVIYAGALCYVAIIKHFGAVPAATVTTVRKILTIISSFLMFPKAFSPLYVWAGVVFGTGLFLGIKKKPKPQSNLMSQDDEKT